MLTKLNFIRPPPDHGGSCARVLLNQYLCLGDDGLDIYDPLLGGAHYARHHRRTTTSDDPDDDDTTQLNGNGGGNMNLIELL